METTEQITLSQTDIVRAATNDPALSERSFMLGDRTFKIVDLGYDDYLRFFALLEPLLAAFAGKLADKLGFGALDTVAVTPTGLLKYCGKSLPEMVCIICNQTDPTITVEDVKQLGKSPFKLASIVLQQIEQNRIIADITDFFVQILPLLKSGKKALASQSQTKATLSS